MLKAGVNPGGICDLYESLPLADVSLIWVPFTILAFVIGLVAYRGNGAAENAAASAS